MASSWTSILGGRDWACTPSDGRVLRLALRSCWPSNSLALTETEELVIADSFVRGHDLVVTYAQMPARPVRLQVYWCAFHEERAERSAVGIDMQVSVQTSLLAAHPALTICSRVRRESPWDVAKSRDNIVLASSAAPGRTAGCFRCSLSSASYVEMVHPSDVEKEELSETADGWLLSHELFEHSLEKGVILRARARGVFVAPADESALVPAIYERFLAAPLPLTT